MASAMYTPTTDIMERHEYGVRKHHRKTSSTGGGRAWSEDEELYLLQTRMQKMPYKHIAAHLKKTELACRLHYHQLSHGSNRRKRTTSMSSSASSSNSHSPLMHTTMPSPIHESPSRSVSPQLALNAYGGAVQLPSIMSHHGLGAHSSPRLPAILPKPANMTLPSNGPRYSPILERSQQAAPLLPSATFTAAAHPLASSVNARGANMNSLCLDCTNIPAPTQQSIDMSRLQAVYSNQRCNFWTAVAAEYGNGVHPSTLEQAWRAGNSDLFAMANGGSYATATPLTPIGSPDERDCYKQNRTRISALLGIDANPRSPKERELVRRMEEERVMVGVGA
ncbi:hypothetical protein BD289DRAFT_374070 [Coniella lustricola]|uniref:Myb-like domain-containing protein n=1 Tax=Coniella lustricola TaxID=2025994 RepID=A0A2T3A068_9PEZI|nr:hypothetical protein BD289DRAFT_374070 [Coniella lustricola]